MNPLIRQGIAKLFRSIGGGPGTGSSYKELGTILARAKQGSDEAFQVLQQKLADIGITLKNKKDLAVEEVKDLSQALDEGIDFASKYMQKLTGGGMDAPLKKGGIVGFKKGGVVRGLDEGIHKNVRLI